MVRQTHPEADWLAGLLLLQALHKVSILTFPEVLLPLRFRIWLHLTEPVYSRGKTHKLEYGAIRAENGFSISVKTWESTQISAIPGYSSDGSNPSLNVIPNLETGVITGVIFPLAGITHHHHQQQQLQLSLLLDVATLLPAWMLEKSFSQEGLQL